MLSGCHGEMKLCCFPEKVEGRMKTTVCLLCVFCFCFFFYLSNHFILVDVDEARQTTGQRHAYQLRYKCKEKI